MTTLKSVPAGTTFGRLTVLGEAGYSTQPSGQRKRLLSCRCACGVIVQVHLSNLRSGATTSCGCFHREKAASTPLRHGQSRKDKHTTNYDLWRSIINRAVSGTNSCDRYSARGITLYPPWVSDFVAFNSWLVDNLGPRPEGYSLDRINNDGNYEPGNLRWATPEQQNNNKRNNVRIAYQGETRTISQWARLLNINYSTLRKRLQLYNWPIERAFSTPSPSWRAR